MENGTGMSTVDSVRDRGAEARHMHGLARTVEPVPQQLQTGFRCPGWAPAQVCSFFHQMPSKGTEWLTDWIGGVVGGDGTGPQSPPASRSSYPWGA